MSNFTSLHRILDSPPGLITDAMLDEAVDQKVGEQADLDWKRELPSQPIPPEWRDEFAKDVAAMANFGGGLIVFGIKDKGGKAVGRYNVGIVDERVVETMRKIAVSNISPPVFNLEIQRVESGAQKALIVEVPASVDVPHLIFKRKYADFHFAAPVRNGASTEYMSERQIEQMYRVRLGERTNTARAVAATYEHAARNRLADGRVWLIGVVRPRMIPTALRPRSFDEAKVILSRAQQTINEICVPPEQHPSTPLSGVPDEPLRKGMRCWMQRIDRNVVQMWVGDIVISDDGGITAVMGLRPGLESHAGSTQVASSQIEVFVASLAALAQANAAARGAFDAGVQFGIKWDADTPLMLSYYDSEEQSFVVPEPLYDYEPVQARWWVGADPITMQQQVHDLALDAVNQGGITTLTAIANRFR